MHYVNNARESAQYVISKLKPIQSQLLQVFFAKNYSKETGQQVNSWQRVARRTGTMLIRPQCLRVSSREDNNQIPF